MDNQNCRHENDKPVCRTLATHSETEPMHDMARSPHHMPREDESDEHKEFHSSTSALSQHKNALSHSVG